MADGPAGFTQGSTCPALLGMPLCFTRLRVRDCHPLRTGFPDGSTHLDLATTRSHNPAAAGTAAVWAAPRSLAATGGITFCFLFLRVLRCFSSPGLPPCKAGIRELHSRGLPHSDIRGSTVACTYPQLFAACHVLRRLPEPQASAVRPFLFLAVHHMRTCPHTTRIPSAFSCDLFVFSFVVPVCQSPTSPLRDEEPGGE